MAHPRLSVDSLTPPPPPRGEGPLMGWLLNECLVKSTKRCLEKLLGNAKLNYEVLLTVMTEVEAVLNSRPLTYVYSEDIETPSTPSHLVMGKRLLTLFDITCSWGI